MAPHVSICIPCYNASRFIGSTIESVLASAYSDFELIVSDDASTDDTVQAVARFTDPRIRVMRNETNLGAPKNWNRALASASGDYVGLLNHDDTYGPFWLPFAVHVLDKYPHIGWVTTAFRVINSKGHTLQLISRFPHTGEQNRREVFLCLAQFIGLGPFYLARRQVLEEVGYYDPHTGPAADTDLYLRMLLKYPLYYSTYPHVTKQQHDDNLAYRSTIPEWTWRCQLILNKVFNGTSLPQELRDCEHTCYTELYRRAVDGAKELLKKGDLDSVQSIFRTLADSNYRSC